MSEYEYYEFQALDRRLTAAEMARLRAVSTRARITPTSFVNDYEWGNFKGDEDAWMERYFDAFLYFANWGTRVSLPRGSRRRAPTSRGFRHQLAYCSAESEANRLASATSGMTGAPRALRGQRLVVDGNCAGAARFPPRRAARARRRLSRAAASRTFGRATARAPCRRRCAPRPGASTLPPLSRCAPRRPRPARGPHIGSAAPGADGGGFRPWTRRSLHLVAYGA